VQRFRSLTSGMAVVLVVGCTATGPAPSAVPAASPSASPTATVPPPASPTGAPRRSALPAAPSIEHSPEISTPTSAATSARPTRAEELFAVEWETARRLPDDDDWEDPEGTIVAAGGLGFVAVGTQGVDDLVAKAYHSADGTSWTVTSLPGGESAWPTGLAVDGLAVAVGHTGGWYEGPGPQGEVWTSSDGVTWSHRSLAGGWPEVVTVGGPGYVAVGYATMNDWAEAPEPVSWTSRDGQRWSGPHRLGHDCETCSYLRISDVLSTETGLVAIGKGVIDAGATAMMVWTSADGRAWRRGEVETPRGYWEALATGGPGMVAVGQGGKVWASDDGATWSLFGGRPPANELWDVAPVADFLVAVGADGRGATILASRDGLRWYRFLNLPTALSAGPFVSVAVLDNRIVAMTEWGDVVMGTYRP
jgi:hypothetical protein